MVDDRPAALLANGAPFLRAVAADVVLDRIQAGNTFERLAGDGRGACSGEFVEAPPDARPAEGKLHIPALRERAIASITIDLQDAL